MNGQPFVRHSCYNGIMGLEAGLQLLPPSCKKTKRFLNVYGRGMNYEF